MCLMFRLFDLLKYAQANNRFSAGGGGLILQPGDSNRSSDGFTMVR